MNILAHDMTPIDPLELSPNRAARFRKSLSSDEVITPKNFRLRHATSYQAAYSSNLDLKRGTLGINQSLDGKEMTSQPVTRPQTIGRAASSDSFYMGGISYHQRELSKDQRIKKTPDTNNPESSSKKQKEREELAYYEKVQREERENMRGQYINERATEVFQWPHTSTSYSNHQSGASTYSGYGRSRANSCPKPIDPERIEKLEEQKAYATALDEQVRNLKAQKFLEQYEDNTISQKLAAEPFIPPHKRTTPRRFAKTQEEMSRTPSASRIRSYSAELDAQIRERELRKNYDKVIEQCSSPVDFNPFGRPGAGAPLATPSGEPVAHLKRYWYKEQVDYNQLRDRDHSIMINNRNEYKYALDQQLHEREQSRQRDRLESSSTSRNMSIDALDTNGVSLPIVNHLPTSSNQKHGYKITDVVLRPPNGSKAIRIHGPSDKDYEENAGLAFGRPGAGAPILDPYNVDDIDPHLRGVHKKPASPKNPIAPSVSPTRPGTRARHATYSYSKHTAQEPTYISATPVTRSRRATMPSTAHAQENDARRSVVDVADGNKSQSQVQTRRNSSRYAQNEIPFPANHSEIGALPPFLMETSNGPEFTSVRATTAAISNAPLSKHKINTAPASRVTTALPANQILSTDGVTNAPHTAHGATLPTTEKIIPQSASAGSQAQAQRPQPRAYIPQSTYSSSYSSQHTLNETSAAQASYTYSSTYTPSAFIQHNSNIQNHYIGGVAEPSPSHKTTRNNSSAVSRGGDFSQRSNYYAAASSSPAGSANIYAPVQVASFQPSQAQTRVATAKSVSTGNAETMYSPGIVMNNPSSGYSTRPRGKPLTIHLNEITTASSHSKATSRTRPASTVPVMTPSNAATSTSINKVVTGAVGVQRNSYVLPNHS